MNLRKHRFSLKYKIAFTFMLLVVIVMATVTYLFTIRELGLRVNQVELRMERLANNLASIRSVETEDWSIYQTIIDNQIRLNPDVVYIAILNEEERLQAHTLNADWVDLGISAELSPSRQASVVRQLMEGRVAEESQRDFASKSVNIMMGGRDSGSVRVGFSLVDLNNEMLENLYRNLRLGLIFLILAVLMSLFLSDRIIKPLQKLTKAMLKIPAGELDQEMLIRSHDEIGEMARTFNWMVLGLREKKVIEDFTRELGGGLELKTLCCMIRDRIGQALDAEEAILLLRDKNQDCDFYLTDVGESGPEKLDVHCSPAVYRSFQADPEPRPLASLAAFPEFHEEIKSRFFLSDRALLFPMHIKGDCLGLFILQAREKRPVDAHQKAFLSTLVAQGVMAIENALLMQDLTEKERLKREIEIARSVQQKLLPGQNPDVKGLEIDGRCVSAVEVGGDYFDFFELDGSKTGIVIADVTGKGTSAAFYMAMIKGLMLSLAAVYASPKKLLTEINRRLWGRMERKIFVTMIYAVYDPKARTLVYARAGHNGLMIRKRKTGENLCLAPKGIGLGLEEGSLFNQSIEEETIKVDSGDRLLFYTDGAFEARNLKDEEFGEARLLDIFGDSESKTAAQINESILAAVADFTTGALPHDDITLIAINVC
jgi:serine phosphatase RsbU (regulator of sigma subunit)/HAMP domain-containing protein